MHYHLHHHGNGHILDYIKNHVINLVTIYRHPDTNILDFCCEFTDILEQHINQIGELVLMGDFNITVNRPFNPDPSPFLDLLDSLPSKQDCGTNTLDLIIHNADSNIVPSTKVGRLFLDHYVVFFRLFTNLWPKHPGLKHTESTLTLIILNFSHDINKELEETLQEKHSSRRSSAIITL